VRNTFTWKGLQLSANVMWKAGYVFKRGSISPYSEYLGSSGYHTDYFKRWKAPGDERVTDVPAWSGVPDTYRGVVYSQSKALITPGAHIRLRDVVISYALGRHLAGFTPVKNLRIHFNARNLGIIWRA